MNTRYKNVKFTFKPNNNLSFLDVKISKEFSTPVFRKATFGGVSTNFQPYKTGLIFTLLFRCFTICPDMLSFHLEVDQLQQIF